MIDLAILEAHGLCGDDEVRVHLNETASGRIHITTTGYHGRKLTATEARYLAARLLRLAWRAEARDLATPRSGVSGAVEAPLGAPDVARKSRDELS